MSSRNLSRVSLLYQQLSRVCDDPEYRREESADGGQERAQRRVTQEAPEVRSKALLRANIPTHSMPYIHKYYNKDSRVVIFF